MIIQRFLISFLGNTFCLFTETIHWGHCERRGGREIFPQRKHALKVHFRCVILSKLVFCSIMASLSSSRLAVRALGRYRSALVGIRNSVSAPCSSPQLQQSKFLGSAANFTNHQLCFQNRLQQTRQFSVSAVLEGKWINWICELEILKEPGPITSDFSQTFGDFGIRRKLVFFSLPLDWWILRLENVPFGRY